MSLDEDERLRSDAEVERVPTALSPISKAVAASASRMTAGSSTFDTTRRRTHRASPFDLTAEEWVATGALLVKAKAAQDERLAPDGYFLSWSPFREPTNSCDTCTRICTSSRASTTNRLPTKADGQPSRCTRTGGPIPAGPEAERQSRSDGAVPRKSSPAPVLANDA